MTVLKLCRWLQYPGISKINGTLLNNFNGIVSPLVFDKETKIKTLANDGGSVMEFFMRNNILFSGKTLLKKEGSVSPSLYQGI